MVHYSIDNKLKDFFKETFNINLDDYDNDQQQQIIKNVINILDNKVKEERHRYIQMLSNMRNTVTSMQKNNG